MLPVDFSEMINKINEILPIEDSFDVCKRDFTVCGRKAFIVFIDGFAKDDMLLFTISRLQSMTTPLIDADRIANEFVSYIELEQVEDMDTISTSVLSGSIFLYVEGISTGFIIDARQYPARNTEESQVEKVTKGSRDGFVETLVFNTALIRRRIRDKNLCFRIIPIGKRSKTDVTVAYIKDLVDTNLLNTIIKKLEDIKIGDLSMGEKSLEEVLFKKKWYNPLPNVRTTERPDICAAHLYEGHVIILTDTSPEAIILPSTIFYFSQYVEDYYENPLAGKYTRLVRFTAMLITLLLMPAWLMLTKLGAEGLLPEFISFIGVKEESTFSVFIQFLILEMGIDLLKLSSLHTPNNLAASFGVVGGLLLGEFAVKVGFFVPETIFYTAITAVSTYCIPNIEFGDALRIFRLFILISTGLFSYYGFGISLLIVFIITLTTETIDKKRPYLWPLIPFNFSALTHVLFRKPLHQLKREEE